MFGTVLCGRHSPQCCHRLLRLRSAGDGPADRSGIERAPTSRRRACGTPTRKVAKIARPWPKKSAWPYVAKGSRRSYTLGFYDHDKVERSRAFPSVKHARDWMDDYITADRRGRDSLRRFLLDLDAKEAN